MHSASMYLSEARSGLYTTSHPRLHSLRSLSLGLLKTSLSEAVSGIRNNLSQSRKGRKGNSSVTIRIEFL